MDTLDDKIIAIEQEMQYLEKQEKKHLSKDLEQRVLIHAFTDVSKMLHNRHVSERLLLKSSPNVSYPLRSEPLMVGHHIDDCSAQKPPMTGLTTLHPLNVYNNSLNGQYNLTGDHPMLYMSEAGLGKTASCVLEEYLMNVITNINGEQANFNVYDCGPLNHGSLVAAALLMLLVDLGLIEFSLAIFFWQNVRNGVFFVPIVSS